MSFRCESLCTHSQCRSWVHRVSTWENYPSHSRWYGFPSMIFPRLRSTREFNYCSSVNWWDTTRARLHRVLLHLHTNYWYHQRHSPFAPENCTTDRECVYTSRVWASRVGQSDARPLNESTRNNTISFNLLLTTCLSTKLTGETILL